MKKKRTHTPISKNRRPQEEAQPSCSSRILAKVGSFSKRPRGRPRLSLEEHVRRGTYRPSRHGPLPPGLEIPQDVAERLRAERTAYSKEWYHAHPEQAREHARRSYKKRVEMMRKICGKTRDPRGRKMK